MDFSLPEELVALRDATRRLVKTFVPVRTTSSSTGASISSRSVAGEGGVAAQAPAVALGEPQEELGPLQRRERRAPAPGDEVEAPDEGLLTIAHDHPAAPGRRLRSHQVEPLRITGQPQQQALPL